MQNDSARPIVELTDVGKRFDANGKHGHIAVESVSFFVRRGETVCVVGKTGCGKSTLVNMLLGLTAPTQGRIVIDGVNPAQEFMHLREKISAVFQTDRLLPWRTVVDNAALGLEARSEPRKQRREQAAAWLAKVGLERWKDAYPHQLSGGMRQRVAIVRAFVLDPAVLLLDEAFGHLDEVTAHELRNDCLGLVSETGKAVLMVTHNITEALEIADRIVVLGRPARVLGNFEMPQIRDEQNWEARMVSLRTEIFQLIDSGSAELAPSAQTS